MVAFLLLLASPFQVPADKAPSEPKLREELAAMVKADQDARFTAIAAMKGSKATKPGTKPAEPPEMRAVREIDQKNRTRLKEIVKQHGWPTVSMVGVAGAHD